MNLQGWDGGANQGGYPLVPPSPPQINHCHWLGTYMLDHKEDKKLTLMQQTSCHQHNSIK